MVGFRRAPVQIKGLTKAIWSCFEGWWFRGRGGVMVAVMALTQFSLSHDEGTESVIPKPSARTPKPERLVIYCQTSSVSAAHATHCATYCTPCRPLFRAFSGWILTPPPTVPELETPSHRALNQSFRSPKPESRIPNPESRVPNTEYRIPNTEHRI